MDLTGKKCIPCEGGVLPIAEQKLPEYLSSVNGWELSGDKKSILKKVKFKNFKQSLDFVNKVGEIADDENHHPDIEFGWGYCNVTLQTHSIGGLHENDFIVAKRIDLI